MFSLVILFYLADVCDAIHLACNTVFILMAIFLCIGVFVLMLFSDCCDSDELEEKLLSWKNYVKNTVIAGVVTGIIFVLTPSQKTVYMIAGGIMVNQVASEVINSDLYKKIYKLINDKLDYIVKTDED